MCDSTEPVFTKIAGEEWGVGVGLGFFGVFFYKQISPFFSGGFCFVFFGWFFSPLKKNWTVNLEF